MLNEGRLRENTLVATVMSNTGLEEAMKSMGGRLVRTAVGDRYVVEEMVRGGYNLGGEQSGHIIFLDHTTTGDGIISALQLIAVMRRENRPLSELTGVMRTYPQVLLNVKVREKRDVKSMPRVATLLEETESELGDEGRVFIRYSGTESLARITVEGIDGGRIKVMADNLAEAMREELG
jgi:phosphoglucosamine mutase